jgi:non-specific protein-tyrosine kinase
MKLKKSIEKAKAQREQAIRRAKQDASAVGKQADASSVEPADAAAQQSDAPVEHEARITGAEEGATLAASDNTSGQDWCAPVYCESRSIELDLEKLARNRCVSLFPDTPEAESYKILRTNIQHRARENNWNTIMVTSVQPGEGKTLTSINLAVSLAKEFQQTVLLVDCDLRRQKIHKYLNYRFDKGLVDYLLNGNPLKDLIIWPSIDKLTLISGGKTVSDSTELLGSPKMKALVQEIKTRYDDRYVIFDVPPILGGADAIAFAPLVDCIVMVVEEGRTSIHDVKKSLDMIPREKFLGFVLNRRKDKKKGYYYY